ncbi:MAG: ribosome biogenesis GTPase Der [Actinobacteria bacterium]|nr:ribosome biogenesis GTPase Der [Actinomycetota bacterium]
MSERKARLPKVAIVGRPNVGKSTLVNRLAAKRSSIVGEISGLTRDRLDTKVSWRGRTFIAHDTGGLADGALRETSTIGGKVAAKAVDAASKADVVLFVVDASTGVTSDDLELTKRMKRLTIPVLLVANKVDDAADELEAAEFWSLGLGEPLVVSALHGRGSGDLLDRVVDLLPEVTEDEIEEPPAIAIVGRPNVGKSSLFNQIVGEDRSIVHHEAGTTRDSIDTTVEIQGKEYRFIDTAGMRRRAKTQGVEIYSASRTRSAIERADVAILVVDALEGATSQDQRIAEAVAESGVGAIVALNKWDLIEGEEMADRAERSMKDRLHFIDYAPMIRTSALTKRGMSKLLRPIDQVLKARNLRIATAKLNQLIQDAQQSAPAPRTDNRNVKVLYGTQVDVAPPSFVLFSTGRLATSWLRYLERKIREQFDFTGNPLQLKFKERTR